MGELILLTEWRADRSRPARGARPAFFFDLACPFSYLAAERLERFVGDVDWVPADTGSLALGEPVSDPDSVRAAAEARASAARTELVWPERFPSPVPRAMRAAAHAAEIGEGARFALAAGRLAFCGGFDLEDPEIIAAAAGAAGIGVEQCLAALWDTDRDLALRATADGLRMRGVRQLPALRIGTRFLAGELDLAQAGALLRSPAVLPAC